MSQEITQGIEVFSSRVGDSILHEKSTYISNERSTISNLIAQEIILEQLLIPVALETQGKLTVQSQAHLRAWTLLYAPGAQWREVPDSLFLNCISSLNIYLLRHFYQFWAMQFLVLRTLLCNLSML